jgi:hypothetical protein
VRISLYLSSFVALSVMSISVLAQAENSKLVGAHLIFAAGYGTLGQAMNNHVLIGNYTFSAQSFAAEYKEFDANADLKPKKAAFHHDLETPFGKHACEDKLFDIPAESATRSVKGTWQSDGKKLSLIINAQTYEWEMDEGGDISYKLRSIRDNTTNQDLPLSVGFAYVSNGQSVPAKLRKDNFLPYYRGDIYHKNNNTVAKTPWEFKPSGLKVSVFSESNNGDFLSYSSVDAEGGKNGWVGNGILLNYDNKSSSTIYQDLGHDFNKNGCYDEFGHNKVILAAFNFNSTVIYNMVYIEYSYAFDGFPMISIGRYYR